MTEGEGGGYATIRYSKVYNEFQSEQSTLNFQEQVCPAQVYSEWYLTKSLSISESAPLNAPKYRVFFKIKHSEVSDQICLQKVFNNLPSFESWLVVGHSENIVAHGES